MLFLALLLAIRIIPDAPQTEYRQPQLASGEGIVAVTFGAGNAVYFAASHDHGRTFSKPVKVAEDGRLALGRHRGPRIAITPKAIVISSIVGQKGGGHDGDLVAWRSTDGGRTWSPGVAVNDVPGAAREGLHGMAAGPKGLLYAVWLDLRQKGTRLFGARSTDGGATWSKNVLVYESPDGHICECCHPTVAIDGDGHVLAMWRNWLGGARDMYAARSQDGGLTFAPAEKLGHGTWPLNACPMDGGGLAFSREGDVVSAWRRADGVYLALGHAQERELSRGKDPAIAMGPAGVYVAWSTPAGLHALVPGKPEPVALAEDGAYVQLVSGSPVVAAWESQGAIVIETLR